MAKLRTSALQSQISQFQLYCLYVDDIFVVRSSAIDPEELVTRFYNAHSPILFIMEIERDNSIAFLLILIKWPIDRSQWQKIFWEQTWVAQCVHLYSTVSLQRRRILMKTDRSSSNNLIQRMLRIRAGQKGKQRKEHDEKFEIKSDTYRFQLTSIDHPIFPQWCAQWGYNTHFEYCG